MAYLPQRHFRYQKLTEPVTNAAMRAGPGSDRAINCNRALSTNSPLGLRKVAKSAQRIPVEVGPDSADKWPVIPVSSDPQLERLLFSRPPAQEPNGAVSESKPNPISPRLTRS